MLRTVTACVIALALLAAGCGGATTRDGAPPSTTASSTTATTAGAPSPETSDATTTTTTRVSADAFPVTIETTSGPVRIPERPRRIVSLSPTSTEVLFAIGAGDAVVAVDSLSDYPAEAPVTDLSAFQPNVEAIASFTPDLVVVSFDPGDLASGLEALGIPTILHPAASDLDDAYAQIEQLGAATGHLAEAAALVARMRSEIDDIVASLPAMPAPPTYYHELDPTFYSVTSGTFVGELYDLLGLRNIADAADASGSGYPQLSAEYVIDQDPDLIFLADTRCCGQSAASVAERPGWDELTAVRTGRVVELDDSVASRWGPRIVDFLRTVADAVTALEKVGS